MTWLRLFWGGVAIAPMLVSGCAWQPPSSPQPLATLAPTVSPSPVNRPPSVQAQSPSVSASEEAIWSQLRQGRGYVILFRHAIAPGTGDPPNFRLEDCSTQRNLSEEGRQQAVRLGERLRQQNIPIARILSSQWCRCLETAQLMNVGQIEPFPVLNSFFQDRSTAEAQTEQLRQFILSNQSTTGVMVLVTHQVNITAISTIVPASGAGVVMRAIQNRVERVGQLAPPQDHK